MLRIKLAVVFLVLCSAGRGLAVEYPLRVSDNQRFLVDSSGTPFFWQADTCWRLFQGVTREDVTKYLDDRQAKGYNAIMASALFSGEDVHGERPFTGIWGSTPNEAYWRHVDWVVQEIERREMAIGFLPTWTRPRPLGHYDPADVIAYGKFVGQRYGKYKNLVWILGGDVDARKINVEDTRRFANAIESGQGGHTRLMTLHDSDEADGSEFLSGEPWLDLYAQHNDTSGKRVLADHQLSPTKPVLNLEPRYEELFVGRHDDAIRRDNIRCVFSGGLAGLVYGADPIWNLGQDGWNFAAKFWKEHLELPGAKQSTYIRTLMEQWRWYECSPHVLDSQVTEGPAYVPALLANSKQYALVYYAENKDGQSLTIKLDVFEPATVQAVWFDATDGTYRSGGSYPNTGTRSLTVPGPNSRGAYDWILCLGRKPTT
ncbi:Putative collagen-binding domain of a collagenase [Neorhodopirellula lusitana]|uniref:Collagen-binding domain of a collagenase n=1 Tax=Neorhodopirellula lusitana TaxID=445327 RepID=A0ABY1QJH6_9BACT|nr:DUF4038 domain-containing protein [Neorhodopirellula lusitana]SMP73262.1 Putative collagen-binding domain of a collagenase [Neorhodopirellula lusitana]